MRGAPAHGGLDPRGPAVGWHARDVAACSAPPRSHSHLITSELVVVCGGIDATAKEELKVAWRRSSRASAGRRAGGRANEYFSHH